MSSKLGLILSLALIMFVFLFGVDLVMMQVVYANLDSLSETISFKISQNGVGDNGEIDAALIFSVYLEYQVTLRSTNSYQTTYLEGDIYSYSLSKDYNPILISYSPITITITRYTVIGINHT